MSSNRSLISNIRSSNKLLSADVLLSDRAILSELKRCARKLIKQQSDRRRLWQTDTIFTTIPCLEMEEVSIAECCEYFSKDTVSRSKYKLPRIGEGIFQYLIKSVMNITGTKRLNEITLERYINALRLNNLKSATYYWILNGYLYTSNPEIKAIRITAYFEEDVPREIMHPSCEECKNTETEDCLNPYDEEFKAPGFLEKDIIDMTSQKLLGSYHKLQTDQTSNDKDDQVNKV